MRSQGLGSADSEKLLSLQSRLARALYFLEHEILALKAERRKLTKEKAGQLPEELNRKYRNFDSHITALEQVIDRGKVHGDAFIWLFYGHEEELLRRHNAHEQVQHLPVGIGGIGEIEFVANATMFGGRLVLYHGITTFLRIGDVSFANLQSGRIDGIAELKSERADNNEVKVSVNYVGTPLSVPEGIATNNSSTADFRRAMGDRLFSIIKRQTDMIAETLKARRETSDEILSFAPNKLFFDPSPLETLYNAATPDKASSLQISPGLVVVGIKLPATTLAEIVLNERSIDAQRVLQDTMIGMRKLVLAGSHDNAVLMGNLVYPRDSRYSLRFGFQPVFWWPIRSDVIDDLTKGSFIVMTFFNPAHVIKELRDYGFTIKCNAPGRNYSLHAKYGAHGILSIRGVDYFLSLISQNLIREDSIVKLLCTMFEDIKSRNFNRPTKIDLKMSFRSVDECAEA